MSGPWEPHDADGHDDHHDVPGLPDEPAGWSAEDPWSADARPVADPVHDLDGQLPPEPGYGDDGRGDALPAEQPADWSGDVPDADEAEPAHADWSDIVSGPDGGDEPDPTDPAGWGAPADDPFPPALSLDVDPADGGPWADPDLLGSEPEDPEPRTDPPLALLADLTAADGGDEGAGWSGVETSDDPAIRSLAAFWRTAV